MDNLSSPETERGLENEPRLTYGDLIRVDKLTPDNLSIIVNKGHHSRQGLRKLGLNIAHSSSFVDDNEIPTSMPPNRKDDIKRLMGSGNPHIPKTMEDGGGIISVIAPENLPPSAQPIARGSFPEKIYPEDNIRGIALTEQSRQDNSRHWFAEVDIKIADDEFIKPEGIIVHKKDLAKVKKVAKGEIAASPIEDSDLVYIKL